MDIVSPQDAIELRAAAQEAERRMRQLAAVINDVLAWASSDTQPPIPSSGGHTSLRLPMRLQEEVQRCNVVFGQYVTAEVTEVGRIHTAIKSEFMAIKQCDSLEFPRVKSKIGALIGTLSDIVERATSAIHEHAREFALFPDNPVDVWETQERHAVPFRPHRIYLDVTDAKLEQVREIWTLVEYKKSLLRQYGLSRTAGRGKKGNSKDVWVTRWVQRAEEIGERAALAEYRQEECGPGRGQWQAAYARWHRRIRPFLHKSR
jgi:hypothetical protein